MIAIGITGNYGPFGLQTCALGISLLQFGDCGSWSIWNILDAENLITLMNPFTIVSFAAFAVYIPASYACMVENTYYQGPGWLIRYCRRCSLLLRYYSCCFGYGLFASMTTHRHEVIIEELHDDTWIEVNFPYKPGALNEAPTFIHTTWFTLPRLDWRLWFVPLGLSVPDWLVQFAKCLALRNPEVMQLVRQVPPDKPRSIRATLYDYRFTYKDRPKDWEIGSWWRRKRMRTLFVLDCT